MDDYRNVYDRSWILQENNVKKSIRPHCLVAVEDARPPR